MMALLNPRVFMGTKPTRLKTIRPMNPSLFMITRPVGLQTMRPMIHKFGIAVIVSKQKVDGDDNIRKARRRAVWKLDERGSNDVNSGNAGGDSKTLGDVANYDYDINDFIVPTLDVSLTNIHVSKVKQQDLYIYFNENFHKLIHLHRLQEGKKTPEIGNVWCATIKDLVSGEVSKLNFKNKILTLKKDIVMVAKDQSKISNNLKTNYFNLLNKSNWFSIT
ncbi:hypothetical protein LIER_09222 [Lithospermum erythrorhizon]|uniref:Uncharacterized protein n=1 Tax=Lithospermum erythrorhizon TaxID=34254 RepID=A0AAV3PG59_LITER